MRLMTALMITLLAVAPACAQVPTSPAAPAVSVNIVAESGVVSLDAAKEFEVTVKNEGTAPPVGNEASAADVAVKVTGAPSGWTVSIAPSSFSLQNGQSRSDIVLRVSVSADATEHTAELIVTAELDSPLEGLDPITSLTGNSQRATATDTITVTWEDSLTRDVLEGLGPWIYAVLLLLVAAVLVAVGLTVGARRSLVRLSSTLRELPVPMGGRAVFSLQAEGLGKQANTVLLQVSAVPDGWAAFLPAPEITLEPGEVKDLTLVVIAPKQAAVGARQAVLVSATTARAPKASANLEFVAIVGPPELKPKGKRASGT